LADDDAARFLWIPGSGSPYRTGRGRIAIMSDAPRELAMFPLGSVLLPGMPLPLRVFEPRYVAMLSSVLGETEREFGVVLIERGSEVGGGDVRFGVGTVARIVSVEITEGSIVLLATGAARFEVVAWLADDPFPRAQVRELDALELDAPAISALEAAEALVRATIARASEFVELPWPADIALSEESAERIWQVAAIAPLGSLDQFALLRCRTATELLTRLVEETQAADARFTARWEDDQQDDGDFPQ
jgi:Lon protease-like protein